MASGLDTALSSNAATLAYSVSAASNRRLIVGIASEGTQTGNHTCDYGGQTGVLIGSEIAGSGTTQQTVSLFAFTDTQIGAASGTTITAGNVPADYNISARSYQDCEQGTLTNFDTDTSSAATPNPLAALDITTATANAVVVAMTGMGNVGTCAWAAPLTEQTEQQTASATGSMADGEIASTTTVACEGTWTTQNRAAAVAVEIEHLASAGITGVNPTEFNMDAVSVTISGSNFNASQSTGTVYISDAATLAGSANEVDVTNAVQSWSDISINLDLALGGQTIQDNLQTLGPGQRYVIVLTSTPNEYGSSAITLHRPVGFVMSLSTNFAPGSTTQQLTGLTGTFAGGRIEEVLNPSTTNTDVASNGNREDVWNVQSTGEAREVSYDFRVLYGGNVPDTITQTPQATVSPSGDIAATEGIAFDSVAVLTGKGTLESAATQISFDSIASLTGKGDLAATEGIAFSESGTLGGKGDLAATEGITFDESATLEGKGDLAATEGITFGESATLGGNAGISATEGIIFGESATLVGKGDLAGVSPISFTTNGTADLCVPFVVELSSNILAGGENTTSRLTGGGVFGGGRIQDDENPADLVDLATNESGEWAWVIKGSGCELNGITYDFRLVLDDGTPLDAYTQIAQWLVSGAASQISGTIPIVFSEVASLIGRGPLTATVGLAFGETATLIGTGSLAGTMTIAFSSVATLIGKGVLAGTSATIFDSVANLTDASAGLISGSASIVFDDVANLKGNGVLEGTIPLLVDSVVSIDGIAQLSASEAITFGETAALDGKGDLAATEAIIFDQVADLKGDGILSGSISASFSSIATLAGIGVVEATEGIVFGESTLLAGKGDLAATEAIIFDQTSDLKDAGGGQMNGTSNIIFDHSATMSALGDLNGSAAMAFGHSASARSRMPISGTIPITFSELASIDGIANLSGTIPIEFDQSGAVTSLQPISGTIAFAFSSIADLSARGVLSGIIPIVFTESGEIAAVGTLAGSSDVTFGSIATIGGGDTLEGSVDIAFGSAATLHGISDITGSVDISFGATGSIAGTGNLQGTISVLFGGDGTLVGKGALSGTAGMTFSQVGTIVNSALYQALNEIDVVLDADVKLMLSPEVDLSIDGEIKAIIENDILINIKPDDQV